jgi:hypothetical protein
MRLPLIVTSGLVLALAATTFAGAQSTPPPLPVPTPIPVATLPPTGPNDQLIRTVIGIGAQILQRNAINARNNASGTVSYFRRFDMQVQCGATCYRNVRLHPGTIINPRGATPGVGTSVDVNGHADPDGTIEADTITVRH